MSIDAPGAAGRPVLTREERSSLPELVACPECGGTAEIIWHRTCMSTAGPVDHAFVLCASWHHFLMPAAGLGVHAVDEVTAL